MYGECSKLSEQGGTNVPSALFIIRIWTNLFFNCSFWWGEIGSFLYLLHSVFMSWNSSLMHEILAMSSPQNPYFISKTIPTWQQKLALQLMLPVACWYCQFQTEFHHEIWPFKVETIKRLINMESLFATRQVIVYFAVPMTMMTQSGVLSLHSGISIDGLRGKLHWKRPFCSAINMPVTKFKGAGLSCSKWIGEIRSQLIVAEFQGCRIIKWRLKAAWL